MLDHRLNRSNAKPVKNHLLNAQLHILKRFHRNVFSHIRVGSEGAMQVTRITVLHIDIELFARRSIEILEDILSQ